MYFVAAAATIATTRFDDGVAFLWIATALLTALLVEMPKNAWPSAIGASAIGSVLATGLVGIGWQAALPLAAINVMEAWIAATLLRRVRHTDAPFESLGWLFRFVASSGIVAPLVTAAAAAAATHLTNGMMIGINFIHWYTGHALGALTFTPVAILFLRGDMRMWPAGVSLRRKGEAVFVLGLVAVTIVAVFAQSVIPMLFLPMLPIILATFRLGRAGAALCVVMLAVIGGTLTLGDLGPIARTHGTTGMRMQFFQFYLAATVLTVLPVAADLARRARLFRALRDSEARYRVLADHSTDIILNLDVDGAIRFASPSVSQLGGYRPADLIGRKATTLIVPDQHTLAEASHRAALLAEGRTITVDYLCLSETGEPRWFENQQRAIIDEHGHIDGVVSVARDISARKALEAELARAASTDPLTGLPNRRAFLQELSHNDAGCIAVFDLDRFKRINDTYGHAAGDRVLETFAEVARLAIRPDDMVARIGGEEFALLLSGATIHQAELVCDRLRAAVANMPIAWEGADIRVTVSGGVASLNGRGGAITMRAADEALYRAKAQGRDRLAIAA
jgi:diguanylate cyclase (GGDEF)-like protein/PAS domain S-box-containing protein